MTKRSKKKPSIFDGLARTISLSIFCLLLLLILIGVLEVFFYGRFVENMPSQNIIIASADPENSAAPVVVLHLATHVSPQVDRKGIEAAVLSPDIPVEVVGGYGEYQLRSVLPLLVLDKKDAQTIRTSFAFGLNMGISQVWHDQGLPENLTQADLQQLGWRLSTGRVKTTLPPWQQFHWGIYLSRASDTDITIKQAASMEEWDQAKQWWTLGKLLHVCTVAVVNTTQTAGLGAKVSQVLEETGLNVIRVTSDQQQYDQTTIFADSPESELGVACNQVISIVEDFIPHQGPVMADPQVAQQQRADVVIRLGQDI